MFSEELLLKNLVQRINDFDNLFCIVPVPSCKKMDIGELSSFTQEIIQMRPLVYVNNFILISRARMIPILILNLKRLRITLLGFLFCRVN